MKTYKYNLSHSKVLSCKMGSLVPVMIRHTLPGDRFKGGTHAFIRIAPLLAPIMHTVKVRLHHWFVPYRLLWDDWEKFITGGADGLDASVMPTIEVAESPGESSLQDYMGFDPSLTEGQYNAFVFRAYSLIWNEFYRDKDLQPAVTVSTAAGLDTTTNLDLLNCAWEKDYFTVARPWEQRGPAMTIPMAESAPIVRVPNAPGWEIYNAGANTQPGGTPNLVNENGDFHVSGVGDASLDPNGGLQANLSDVAGTIEELRYAAALQRFEENRARWGGSYPEYLLSLGVRYSDARLQRPQYMGGGSGPLQISEVLQVAPDSEAGDSEDEGVGNIKGHGIGSIRSNRFKRYFEEHGVVLTLMSVRPRAVYASGMDREFLKRTKEEYWQKELQHLGQQAMTNREVQASHATPNGIFGYTDRYDEYRHAYNTVHGEFRSTLNFWHMARFFTADPALNAAFVKCDPTTRIYAATWEDQLWCMIHNKLHTRRPVVPNPTPKLM